MDKKETVKEPTEDMTRESLIAISYRVPENEVTGEKSPKNEDDEKVVESPNGDGDDKYRSKLISISSSSPSPDVDVPSVLPGKLNG